jgi:CheY-like chemotaxis protein
MLKFSMRDSGAGLSVAISQRFVSLMGGELSLQSELGIGSCFYFTVTLPVAAPDDAQEGKHLRERANSALSRTLIVDDNPTAREVLARMVRSLGWQADQCKASGAPNAPVVVMATALGLEMLSRRSAIEQSLLDGFLVKPATTSMLFDAVVDATADKNHAHRSRIPTPIAPARLTGMRILLVEDNLNKQQVARELLKDEGALVQIANNGQEAVESVIATSAGFEVILMDLQMPVMDGFAATKIVRTELNLTTLPIVAMTANAIASDREACLCVGMNDHVGKPFDLNDLVRILRQQAKWVDALPIPINNSIAMGRSVLQAATAAGVDLSPALRRIGGKQDVYRRMLQTFVKDLRTMAEQLQGFAKTQTPGTPYDEPKRLLQSLKGLAATLGAMIDHQELSL